MPSAVIVRPTAQAVIQAAALLRAGELVALPTETVYGLGADAANPRAVAKIFAAKDRPADHPLIVHLADTTQIGDWARDVPDAALALARAFWPGPLTLILPKTAQVPDIVTGGQDTVGLRVPDHPVALELLRAFGGGIAAPSANRFGRISPTTAQHVEEELGARVAMILDGGPCDVGIESTIIDLSRGEAVILRPGIIGVQAIAAVIGQRPRLRGESSADSAAPRVSGSLAAHYAPRTPMRMVAAAELALAGADCAILARTMECPASRHVMCIDAPFDAPGYAHELYASLRALDASGAARILVEDIPTDPAWDAIRDRLERAAAGSDSEDDET